MAVHKTTLTNCAVAALKVERDMVYWDRDLPGFGIRVYPGGGKVYIAQAREPDKTTRRVTVGRHDVLSADQARQRAAFIITRIRAGEDPVPLPLAARLQRRPHGGRPRQALSRRACRGADQAEDTAADLRHADKPRPAGSRQAAARGGGAERCRRAAPETVRPAGHREQVRQGPVAHVPAGRGMGPGARGLQSLPVGREISRAFPRAFPDRCRVHPAGAGTGRGGRQRRGSAEGCDGDPTADADRLPQERDSDPTLVGRRSRRSASSNSATPRPVPVRSSWRRRRWRYWKRCRDGRTAPGCSPATTGTGASAAAVSIVPGGPCGPRPGWKTSGCTISDTASRPVPWRSARRCR